MIDRNKLRELVAKYGNIAINYWDKCLCANGNPVASFRDDGTPRTANELLDMLRAIPFLLDELDRVEAERDAATRAAGIAAARFHSMREAKEEAIIDGGAWEVALQAAAQHLEAANGHRVTIKEVVTAIQRLTEERDQLRRELETMGGG